MPPAGTRPAPVAQQDKVEGRMAGRAGLQRRRRRGGDAPPAEGGARPRPDIEAEQDEAGAGRGRRQRQPAAGGQAGGGVRPPQFQHHGAEGRTAHGLVRGAQRLGRIPGLDEEDGRRRAEAGQPVRVKAAMLARRHRLLHPDDDAPFAGQAQRQPERKAAGRAAIGHGGGKDLVHGPARQAAAERRVERPGAQRNPFRRARPAPVARIDAGKAPPEPGKGILLSHREYVPVLFYKDSDRDKSQPDRRGVERVVGRSRRRPAGRGFKRARVLYASSAPLALPLIRLPPPPPRERGEEGFHPRFRQSQALQRGM